MLEAPRDLWELIRARVERTPDREYLVDEVGTRLTFAEFAAESERVAAGLAAMGVREGTNVSWQLPTWIESVVLVAALSRLGAVQNPLLPIYREREVGFILRQTDARLFIVPGVWRGFDFEAMANSLASEQPNLEVLVVDRTLPTGDPATLPPLPAPPATPDAAPIRWLFYTSGTTAEPKGARHTDATIKAASIANSESVGMTEDDASPIVFPFTHVGGIINLFASLMTGCKTVLVEAFDPVTTVDLIVREHCTLAGAGTPFHMAYLAEHRRRPDEKLFKNIRAFPGGGAPKPPQLHYDIKNELGGVGIVSGYGLTEAPILAMHRPESPDDKLATTEGRPTRGVDLRIVTFDGAIAGPGVEGELRIKAPQLCKGYLDSSLDAAAFDENGYFRTGDLGTQDAEGYVAITGRLKDIIIRKGENISAKEVEDLLYTHPNIADVAVVGLPDPATGERACAVASLRDPSIPLTLDDISAFLQDKGLMIQKIPEQLEVVSEIPRNPSGKILKHDLRARFADTTRPRGT